MPFTIELPSAGVVTSWVLIGGLVAKILFDGWQRKSERITALAGQTTADGNKAKADADADHAQANALSLASTTAAQWMDRYAQVLKDLGVMSSEIGQLRNELQGVKAKVETLTKDLGETQAALALEREEHAKTKTTLQKTIKERDEYQQGWDSAMLLLSGAAGASDGQRIDPAMTNVAEAAIRRLLDYDRASDRRTNNNRKH